MKTIEEEFPRAITFWDFSYLLDNYTRLRARAVEMERVQQWRPIETAPKDGTRILGTWANTWDSDALHIEAIECGELGAWFYSYDGDGPPDHKPPTHWQPLPPAPEPHQTKP